MLPTHTRKEGGGRKLWEAINTFITLTVVIVSCVHVCVETHQIVYIKYVQFLCISHTLIKLNISLNTVTFTGTGKLEFQHMNF